MIFFYKIFKSDILTLFLIFSLTFACLILSAKLIFQKEKLLVIETSSKGIRLVKSDFKPQDEEKFIFLRRFFTILLNYDPKTYQDHIEKAGSLMSQSLWNKKKEEFLKTNKEVKEKNLEQQTEVLDIKEVEKNRFKVSIHFYFFIKGKIKSSGKATALVTIKETRRTRLNVWGYEVSYVEFNM